MRAWPGLARPWRAPGRGGGWIAVSSHVTDEDHGAGGPMETV
jgi:hypothetical protein